MILAKVTVKVVEAKVYTMDTHWPWIVASLALVMLAVVVVISVVAIVMIGKRRKGPPPLPPPHV